MSDNDHGSHDRLARNQARDVGENAFQANRDISVTYQSSPGKDHDRRPRAAEPVEQVLSALRDREDGVFKRARRHLDIAESEMIPVRWTPQTHGFRVRGDVVRDPNVVQASSDSADRFVSSLFGNLDYQRLVLLGNPGMGKSSFTTLISDSLLRRSHSDAGRSKSTPVPVSISLGVVDFPPKFARQPFQQGIPSALARSVRRELPRRAAKNMTDEVFAKLLRDGELIVLLDGFEDLTEEYRRKLISFLSFEPRISFILTAQPSPYWDTPKSEELKNALLLAASEPGEEHRFGYIRNSIARHSEEPEKWDSFITALAEDRHTPVYRFLSTPMRLWLLRKTHEQGGPDPNDLFDTTRFPNEKAISDHLYGSLVGHEVGAWTQVGKPRWPRQPRATLPYSEERVLRYLGFLACVARSQGSPGIRWWELYGSQFYTLSQAKAAISAALSILLCAGLFVPTLGVWMVVGPAWAFMFFLLPACLTFAFVVIRLFVNPGPEPRSLRMELRKEFSGRRLTWYRGMVLLLLVLFVFDAWYHFSVESGYLYPLDKSEILFEVSVKMMPPLVLLVVLVFDVLGSPIEVGRVASPRASLREDFRSSWSASVVPSVIYTLGFLFIEMAILVSLFLELAEGGVHGLLDQFTWGILWSALPFLLLFVLVFLLVLPAFTFVTVFILFMMVESFRRAWFSVHVSVFYLWLQGHAPLRFFKFLDYMVECALVRPLGSTYRFRHSELREYLADRYEGR